MLLLARALGLAVVLINFCNFPHHADLNKFPTKLVFRFSAVIDGFIDVSCSCSSYLSHLHGHHCPGSLLVTFVQTALTTRNGGDAITRRNDSIEVHSRVLAIQSRRLARIGGLIFGLRAIVAADKATGVIAGRSKRRANGSVDIVLLLDTLGMGELKVRADSFSGRGGWTSSCGRG